MFKTWNDEFHEKGEEENETIIRKRERFTHELHALPLLPEWTPLVRMVWEVESGLDAPWRHVAKFNEHFPKSREAEELFFSIDWDEAWQQFLERERDGTFKYKTVHDLAARAGDRHRRPDPQAQDRVAAHSGPWENLFPVTSFHWTRPKGRVYPIP